MATTTKRRSLLSRLFRRKPKPAPRRWPRGDGGSAGVREPRRPNPAPPAMSATVDDQAVVASSSQLHPVGSRHSVRV